MSFESIAQQLASNNSLRVYDMSQDDVVSTKFNIFPEDTDGVQKLPGISMLVRLVDGGPLSGSGKTVSIAATLVTPDPILDIPLNLGDVVINNNDIVAFQLVQTDVDSYEFQLLNLLDIFGLREAVETLQALGFSIEMSGENIEGINSLHKIIAQEGIEIPDSKEFKAPMVIKIKDNTIVWKYENGEYVDKGEFVVQEKVEEIAEATVIEKLNELIIRDTRTPAEYESATGEPLPNGTIYLQLSTVVE